MGLSTVLIILSFIPAILLSPFIIDFPLRYRNKNLNTRFNFERWSIIFLTFILNIFHGTNSALGTWEHNGEVWCDINTFLTVGITITLASFSVQLARLLDSSLYDREDRDTPADRVYRGFMAAFDALFFVVIPLLYMGLHFIVQSHRFDIIEDYGCFPSVHDSAVGVLVLYLPLFIVSFIALLSAGKCFRHVRQLYSLSRHLRTLQTSPSNEYRASTGVSFTSSRSFIANLLLCSLVPIFTAVMAMTGFALSTLQPTVSISEMHQDFGVIVFLPDGEIDSSEGPDVLEALRTRHIISWWCFFGISLVVVGCSWLQLEIMGDLPIIKTALAIREIIQDKLEDRRKWMRMRKTIEVEKNRRCQEVHISGTSTKGDSPSRSSSLSRSQQQSPHPSRSQSALDSFQLVSGWDDMLSKKSRKKNTSQSSVDEKDGSETSCVGFPSSASSVTASTSSPTKIPNEHHELTPLPKGVIAPAVSSPRQHGHTISGSSIQDPEKVDTIEDDSHFITSTMKYLLSDPATQMGIRENNKNNNKTNKSSSPDLGRKPSSVVLPPNSPPGIPSPSAPTFSADQFLPIAGRTHRQTIPDNASAISSLCDALVWPRPPPVARPTFPTSNLQRISDRSVHSSHRDSLDNRTIGSYPIYVVPTPEDRRSFVGGAFPAGPHSPTTGTLGKVMV